MLISDLLKECILEILMSSTDMPLLESYNDYMVIFTIDVSKLSNLYTYNMVIFTIPFMQYFGKLKPNVIIGFLNSFQIGYTAI